MNVIGIVIIGHYLVTIATAPIRPTTGYRPGTSIRPSSAMKRIGTARIIGTADTRPKTAQRPTSSGVYFVLYFLLSTDAFLVVS